ncbi:hypothetical protein L209DRAFT_609935 [Thermothelomyces heterothallicus CBS 203.75]
MQEHVQPISVVNPALFILFSFFFYLSCLFSLVALDAYNSATMTFSQLPCDDLAFLVTELELGRWMFRPQAKSFPEPGVEHGSRGTGHVPGTFLLVGPQWSPGRMGWASWRSGDAESALAPSDNRSRPHTTRSRFFTTFAERRLARHVSLRCRRAHAQISAKYRVIPAL